MYHRLIFNLFSDSVINPPRPFNTLDDFEKFLQFVFVRYPEKLFWFSLKGIESGQLPEEMNDFVAEFDAQKN